MPPPPWAWQPTQFIQLYSRWPWLIWKLTFSYCFARGSLWVAASAACCAGPVAGSGAPRGLRSSRSQPARTRTRRARLAREREDIEPPSRLGPRRKVAHRVDEAERGARVARIERRRHDRARPAADPRHHRDILPPVGAAIADRLADDPAVQLGLPEQPAIAPGPRVDRFEPAVHRPVEHHVAARRERSAPQRQILLQ